MLIDEAQYLLIGKKDSTVQLRVSMPVADGGSGNPIWEPVVISLERTTRYRPWLPFRVTYQNESGVFARNEPTLESEPVATVRFHKDEPGAMQFRALDMKFPGKSAFRKVRISGWVVGDMDKLFHRNRSDRRRMIVRSERVPLFAHWHNVQEKRAPVIHLFPGLEVRRNAISDKNVTRLPHTHPHIRIDPSDPSLDPEFREYLLKQEAEEKARKANEKPKGPVGHHISFDAYMVSKGHETGRTYIAPALPRKAEPVEEE